ncbi:hypothetical protein [Limnohabitans sp.]|uniref:hypothetical protein n=1 Tax=Limnohabitans sp. TaxID=1907725 RepID=UPI0033414FA6
MDLYDVALGPRHSEFRWNSCIVRVKACGALKKDLTTAQRMEEHCIYVRFHMPLDLHTLKRTLEAAWNSPEPIKIKSGREELGTGSLDSPDAVREAASRHLSAYYDRDYAQLRDEYLARVRDAENDPRVGEVAEQEGNEEAEQEEDEEAEQEEDEALQVHRIEPIITDQIVGIYVVTGFYPENGFVIQDENLDMNPPVWYEDYEGFRRWVASIPRTRSINRLVHRLGEDPQRGINISHFMMRWLLSSHDGPYVSLIEQALQGQED